MKFENCKEYCSLKNNKENIRKLMKEFDCEASGKSNLIRPLVTDENGRFDEEKAEKLITELVEDLGDMDDFDIDDIDIVEPIYDNLDADEFVDEGFLQDGHDADESKTIVSVCDQMEDSDKVCSCFASFLDMIYSDEVPYSYLSQMRKAVEGMLDTYMWDHGLSIYSSMDSLKRSKLYLEKAAEKTAYLNAQRKNRL